MLGSCQQHRRWQCHPCYSPIRPEHPVQSPVGGVLEQQDQDQLEEPVTEEVLEGLMCQATLHNMPSDGPPAVQEQLPLEGFISFAAGPGDWHAVNSSLILARHSRQCMPWDSSLFEALKLLRGAEVHWSSTASFGAYGTRRTLMLLLTWRRALGDASPREIPLAERLTRLKRQRGELKGLELDVHTEPGHALVDRVQAIGADGNIKITKQALAS